MIRALSLAAKGSSIAISTLLKALLGLAIGSIVMLAVPSAQAAAYFQLLLLQSILTTFISGAAYARGAKAGLSKRQAETLYRYQFGFSVGMSVVACVLAIILLPSDYVGDEAPLSIIVLLLSAGCVGSAMTSLFQGLLTPTLGRRSVFTPIAVVNGVGLMLCPLLTICSGLLGVTLLLTLSQVAGALVLHQRWRNSRHLLPENKTFSEADSGADWSPLLMGLGSVIFLGAMFGVREAWMAHNDAATVSNVFFILRVSDLLLQVPFLMLSGSVAMEKVVRRTVVGSPAAAGLVIAGATSLGVASAMVLLNMPGFYLMGVPVSLVLAQLVCDANRLCASVMNIMLMRNEDAKDYLFILSLSALLIMPLIFTEAVMENAHGVYIALVVASASQVIMTVFTLRKGGILHGARTTGSF